MGDYLKLFETDSERVEYEGGGSYIEPYVSYVEEDNSVHYNKVTVETRLIATYNVENASNPTPLFVGAESMGFPASSIYDKIEIDNVEINITDLSSSDQGGITVYSYQLTSGEHTVKYTLKDPTMIGAEIDEETGVPSKFGAIFISCPITSVEIPSSVTTIGNNAFGGCTGLTSIAIPNSVTSIGVDAFEECSSLTSVTIPNSVTNISDSTFYDCSSLTSVTIPDSVTYIGGAAFYNCTSLTSVTIGNSVTSIGGHAFWNCNTLRSVTIPNSVTSIDTSAFDVLRLVVIYATTPPSEDIFFQPLYDGNDILTVIQVPSEAVNTYKTTWSDYAEIIEPIPTT